MRFANPQALYLLFSLPALILIYLYRARGKEVEISSLILWEGMERRKGLLASGGKFYRDPLFLLQGSILLVLVAALGEPTLAGGSPGGKEVVLIVDASGSMRAQEKGGSRLQLAKRRAMETLENLRGSQVMLIQAACQATPLAPFTADFQKLRDALQGIQETDCPAPVQEAVARGLAWARGRPQVYLFSDLASEELVELCRRHPEVTPIGVGRERRNLGIVALEARRIPYSGLHHQLLLQVKNFGPRPEEFGVEVRLEGKPLRRETLRAGAGQGVSWLFEVPGEDGERVEARLDVEDPLPADNRAWVGLPQGKKASVLLVTEGNLFLEKALQVNPDIALSRLSPQQYEQRGEKEGQPHDVEVFDRILPGPGRAGHRLLWIDPPPGKGSPLRAGAGSLLTPPSMRIPRPSAIAWEHDHPAMRHADFSGLRVNRAQPLEVPSTGKLLLWAPFPLIFCEERGADRSIVIGFDLRESDLPLRAAFPIFLSNAIAWLAGPDLSGGRGLRPGEIFSTLLPPALTGQKLRVTDPRGRRHEIRPNDGRLYDPETRWVGEYVVEGNAYRRSFAVNPDPMESDIAPKAPPSVYREGHGSSRQLPILPWRMTLWKVPALLALCLIAWEGHLQERRHAHSI